MKRYSTSFKAVGAAYEETLALFQELKKRGNWSSVTNAAYEENFLKKRSPNWIKQLLWSVRRRYFEDHSPLPKGDLLSRFLFIINSNQARVQTLYQYICESDPLVDRLMVALIGNNLKKHNAIRLTKTLFKDFLSQEATDHIEIKKWSKHTKEKWRGDFYAFLRSTGFMEKHPSVLVRKLVLRPETFTFFLYGLIDEGFSPSEIIDSHLWPRYFLMHEEIEERLSEAQVKGWLQYRSMGTISELIPKFDSLEEWINALE
jgi:hypothetical protein